MFQVYDDDRTLKFEGVHLAHATSRLSDSDRWVEFDLYRTTSGKYVASRIGYSTVYHAKGCRIVRRGGYDPAPFAALHEDATSCRECRPTATLDDPSEQVYPEQPRYWAQVCTDAQMVIDALAREDEDGIRYHTYVVKDLLRDASKVDAQVRAAYYVEHVS